MPADDPYVDPRSGVLRNRLGIADPVGLARAEARLAAGREATLFRDRLDLGRYDLAHLQALHRHLFGQIYDWAGQLRTVNMSKGDTLFALAEWIEPQGRQLFDDLARGHHLRGLDRGQFVTGAGQFLSDLNALHPFREGNGRTQRVFLQLLANHAGWQLAWARLDPAENNAASARAMSDRNAFRPLLDRIVFSAEDPVPPDALTLHHESNAPTVRAEPESAAGLAGQPYPTRTAPLPPQPDRPAGPRQAPPGSPHRTR
jgi:cell filamentation protein